MDFVDEEHGAVGGVGEIGEQVFGSGERRAGGDLQIGSQLARNDGRQRGLAQTGRTIEQQVAERLVPHLGGIERDLEPRDDFLLADDVGQKFGPQLVIVARVFEVLRLRHAGRAVDARTGGDRDLALRLGLLSLAAKNGFTRHRGPIVGQAVPAVICSGLLTA